MGIGSNISGSGSHISGWIMFFIGLYALAAAIGELRRPGLWGRMVQEVRASIALQFILGLFTLVTGAVIYLVNPWQPADPLAILVTVLGAWMFVEGALILAIGDLVLKFAARLMGGNSMIFAGLSALIGGLAIFTAMMRLLA